MAAKNNIPSGTTKFDVLLGRGRGNFNNLGNKNFRKMVEEDYEYWEHSNKERQQEIALAIVSEIQSGNEEAGIPRGRFLIKQKVEGCERFTEITTEKAVATTLQCFRNMKSKKKTGSVSALDQIANLAKYTSMNNQKDTFNEKVESILSSPKLEAAIVALLVQHEDPQNQPPIVGPLSINHVANQGNGDAANLQPRSVPTVDSAASLSLENGSNTGVLGVFDSIDEAIVSWANGSIGDITDADRSTVASIINAGLSFEDESKMGELEFCFGEQIHGEGQYTGTVFKGKPHGAGYMFYDNGRTAIACGSWRNGKLEGQACIFYRNQDKCYATFENHHKHGTGTYFYNKKNERYVGNYFLDKKHGKGIYTDSKGNIYNGDFAQGQFHGKGTLKYANGRRVLGHFEKWKLRSEIKRRRPKQMIDDDAATQLARKKSKLDME
ncbi:unnamed protein product [Cylindrotheca closterium]|uniref:DUF6824 domain-containing protein n=1 Tax=Cylindrotheca closterium TaxID=2856 RepID=A0AAD2CGN9_9STRA|nr:unnamed protein product [Cylindrotheca closterium]